MKRLISLCMVCVALVCVVSLGIMGCGSDSCSNDSHCSDGKVCFRGKCSDRSVLNTGTETVQGNEVVAEDSADTGKEPASSEPVEDATLPEPGPEPTVGPEPTPEPAPKIGTRQEGDPCDPRRAGHARDLCAPSYECAELSQTAPSSGAPQPSGVCLKACSKDKPDCPAGTACTETLDTKTRQTTGLFVCAKEVGEGEFCVGTTACKKGLSCIRFGTTGTFWMCQKDCSQDANICGSNEVCKAIDDKTPTKICKPKVSRGGACNIYSDCGDSDLCASSEQNIFSPLCQAKCGTPGATCPTGEACVNQNGQSCYKVAKDGEECQHGYVCETGYVCSAVSPGFYSACRKRCGTAKDCAAGEGCSGTRGSNTLVCQPELTTGEVQLGAYVCASTARAITFSSGGLGVCLHNCSNGGSTAPEKCGALTPGILRGLWWNGTTVWTVGEIGLLAQSADNGAKWSRSGPPSQADFTGIAADGTNQIAVVGGRRGVIVRSEDSGKTWTVVNRSSDKHPDLWGIALSWDGKMGLAVGSKGAVWRSEDGGKTWNSLALNPAVAEDLHAVAWGQDQTGTSPVAVAVGSKGTVLRSEDGGKTWSAVAITGVTDGLQSVALVRDPAVSGFNALAVGEKGLVLESTDAGKTWNKVDVSRTETLRGATISGNMAWIVGDAATILSRDSAGQWTYTKATITQDFYKIAVSGNQVVMVGGLGQVLYSGDQGKTWKTTDSKFSFCLGLSNNGGGACGFVCTPSLNGKDCPPELNTCRAFTISGQTINVCINGTTINGAGKAGDLCSRSAYAPLHARCGANLACVSVGTNENRCLTTCDVAQPQCPTGQKCLVSVALGAAFCGTEAGSAEGCDWGKTKFCPAGTVCRSNVLSGKFVCEAIKLAKLHEHCLPGQVECESGLVCTGNSNVPYRQFCTKRCNPAQQNSCDPSWQCVATSGGSGVCIETCNSADYVCKVKNLQCNKFFTTGSHCI